MVCKTRAISLSTPFSFLLSLVVRLCLGIVVVQGFSFPLSFPSSSSSTSSPLFRSGAGRGSTIERSVSLSSASIKTTDLFSVLPRVPPSSRKRNENVYKHLQKHGRGSLLVQAAALNEQGNEDECSSVPQANVESNYDTKEVGRIQLLVKAASDGESLGDCPFAHYIQMLLRQKKLPYQLIPMNSETKPDWLIENYNGKLPCLVHEGEAYTESSVIAQYLDYFFPSDISFENDDEAEAVEEATKLFFSSMAKYIKHVPKDEDDEELKKNLFFELEKINTLLKEQNEDSSKSKGIYLLGPDRLSTGDLSLIPKLYHLIVTLKEFKGVTIPTEYTFLNQYIAQMQKMDLFINTSYPEEVIIWGWSNARGTAK